MKQEQNTATEVLDLKPEQIAEYLQVNPEFFEQNQSLLNEIRIPHLSGEGTISLIERQIEILRNNNAQLKDQLKRFATLATENEELWLHFKDYAVLLLKQSGLEDRILLTEQWLKQQYKLASVKLIADLNLYPQLTKTLLERIQLGQIQCGTDFSQEAINALFADDASKVKSSALIPLKNSKAQIQGVLVLGAQEPERFSAQQSTAYLECMSALTSQAFLAN